MPRILLNLVVFLLISSLAGCQTPGMYGPDGDVPAGSGPVSTTPKWLQDLFDVLGDAATEGVREKLDKSTGKAKGKVVNASITGRTHDTVVFAVSYKGVRDPGEVYLEAEVFKGGYQQTEFSAPLRGTARGSGC
jgi:predicted small lipoprotein YifL